MGWFILFAVVAFIFMGYKNSDAKTFLYYGPERDKYNDAFVGILTQR